MKIENEEEITSKIISNKTIMDYAKQYCDLNKINNKEMAKINQIRLYKKVYLLYELVGMTGCKMLEYYYNINKQNLIRWKSN